VPTAPTPEILSRHLRLSAVTLADAADFVRLYAQPGTRAHWDAPPLADEAAAVALIGRVQASVAAGRAHAWAIRLRAGGPVIGACNFHRWQPAHQRATLGFFLDAGFWGRGLMREAVQTAIDFGWTGMHLHRIQAEVSPDNPSAIHLLERLGFVREGSLRDHVVVDGGYRDAWLYALLDPRGDAAA
jgi:ribosomal-protein-alanine N-acetyltransferase